MNRRQFLPLVAALAAAPIVQASNPIVWRPAGFGRWMLSVDGPGWATFGIRPTTPVQHLLWTHDQFLVWTPSRYAGFRQPKINCWQEFSENGRSVFCTELAFPLAGLPGPGSVGYWRLRYAGRFNPASVKLYAWC